MPPVRHVRARRSVQIPIDQRYPPGCRGLVTSAMSVLFTVFGVSHRFSKRLAEGEFSGQLGSHLTHRWRETESNLRFPNRSAPLAAPSVKQRLAAIRHLFDWLVTGQVVPVNPAASVRGPGLRSSSRN